VERSSTSQDFSLAISHEQAAAEAFKLVDGLGAINLRTGTLTTSTGSTTYDLPATVRPYYTPSTKVDPHFNEVLDLLLSVGPCCAPAAAMYVRAGATPPSRRHNII